MNTATTEIYSYCHPLSLHDALPISSPQAAAFRKRTRVLTLRDLREPAFRQCRSRSTSPWLDICCHQGAMLALCCGGTTSSSVVSRPLSVHCSQVQEFGWKDSWEHPFPDALAKMGQQESYFRSHIGQACVRE